MSGGLSREGSPIDGRFWPGGLGESETGADRGRAAGKSLTVFGSKAETLERVAGLLTRARVLPLEYFSIKRWWSEPNAVLDTLMARCWDRMIVRSSTMHEDRVDTAAPGAYLSVSGVVGRRRLLEAVGAVVRSYTDRVDGVAVADLPDQHVLVQPELVNPVMSGVMFTCDPSTGAPYVVVNYETGGDAAAVTGGGLASLRVFRSWKAMGLDRGDSRQRRLLGLAAELEVLFGCAHLDVEFAFDRDDELCLLQVRPLAVEPSGDDEEHAAALTAIAAKVVAAGRAHPHVCGSGGVFGVMPDWNPAEILGARPRPLALSLYRKLITDEQWALQRLRYGYRDVRGFPLLLDFFGLPYVDVRASCNSLLPRGLDDHLGERLVDHYIDRLAQNPHLHDKVEFEVVFSCYSFTLRERLSAQTGTLFDGSERDVIAECLLRLTNDLLDPTHPAHREDIDSITSLRAKLRVVRDSELDPLGQVYWLLQDCARFGALAFAGFARLGFVATELLRSLVAVGALTEEDVAALMGSLDTVTHRMVADQVALPRSEFLATYGFLRPGTYDIRSPRYDEAPAEYLDGAHGPERVATSPAPFHLPAEKLRTIDALADRHGLAVDGESLIAFIRASIEHRENAKFEFTRHLSEALAMLTDIGAEVGLTAEDMSFVSADRLDELYRGTLDPARVLRESAAEGRRRYELTRRLVLPPLITDPADAFAFDLAATAPNFVTSLRVTGPVRSPADDPADLRGAILLLPSGDPGHDWIFSLGIAGFITRYGGVNSHMAIRAHQFGVPAVIGAGEVLYARWSGARRLTVDCAAQKVEVLP